MKKIYSVKQKIGCCVYELGCFSTKKKAIKFIEKNKQDYKFYDTHKKEIDIIFMNNRYNCESAPEYFHVEIEVH